MSTCGHAPRPVCGHDARGTDGLCLSRDTRCGENDPKEQAEVREELGEYSQDFRKTLTEIDGLALPDAARSAVAAVRPTLEAYIANGNAIVETAFSIRPAAIAALPEFQEAFEKLEGTIETLSNLVETNARAAVDDNDPDAAYAGWAGANQSHRRIGFSRFLIRMIRRQIQTTTRMQPT